MFSFIFNPQLALHYNIPTYSVKNSDNRRPLSADHYGRWFRWWLQSYPRATVRERERKFHGSESSRERKLPGTFVPGSKSSREGKAHERTTGSESSNPWNFRSREWKFLGTKVPAFPWQRMSNNNNIIKPTWVISSREDYRTGTLSKMNNIIYCKNDCLQSTTWQL